MDDTTKLLKTLTEADGLPGYEGPVRSLVQDLFAPLGAVETDRLGSVICRQPGAGQEAGPRVMLAGHMDEIGFMVHYITDEGQLKFRPLGGWWDQVLLGQRVRVATSSGSVTGVIAAKPPHILPADERKKVVEKKDMAIDVGVTSRAEAEALGIRLGDPVLPISPFEVMANGRSLLGKAFDDRAGVALTVEVLQHFAEHDHPNTIYGAATVQEEVGLRGAQTSVSLVDPDVAIVLEVAICGDIPGVKPDETNVNLGGGPALLLLDARMIPNLAFRDLVIETAAALDIPLQLSTMTGGATDGGAIHIHQGGVPTICLGVPTRHIHGHAGIMSRDDYDQTLRLLIALLEALDADTVAGFSA